MQVSKRYPVELLDIDEVCEKMLMVAAWPKLGLYLSQSQCDLEISSQERGASAGFLGSLTGTWVPSCQYDRVTGDGG